MAQAPVDLDNVKKVGNWLSAILLGNTRELIARIDERTTHMSADLKDIKPKVADMSPKVTILWKDRIAPSGSPRQLNAQGQSILESSGIKEIVDEKRADLLQIIRSKNSTNAYDADMVILAVMMDLRQHFPDVVDRLKTGAFNTGSGIDDLLLVGAIYLRNLIFPELGFSVDDLDKPKT